MVNVDYMDGYLQINVRDTGIGMNKEALEHLFERFTQADSSITKLYAGTGLGMASTKELLDLMGGSIDVDSMPGVGSLFKICIPVDGRFDELRDEALEFQSDVLVTDLRILLVDDDCTNNLVTQQLLKDYYSQVDTVDKGDAAIKMIAENAYDVVVTDITMPQIDGEELQQILAYQYPDIPVIALTGNAFEQDTARYLSNGFSGVVTKPFHRDRLITLINSVCSNRHQSGPASEI